MTDASTSERTDTERPAAWLYPRYAGGMKMHYFAAGTMRSACGRWKRGGSLKPGVGLCAACRSVAKYDPNIWLVPPFPATP